jgi:hypothetical protein
MPNRNKLLISNVPRTCSDDFLRSWVEAHGYRVFRLNLIRDTVSGTSPSFAYVQLMNESKLDEAARTLDGRTIANHAVRVERVAGLSVIVTAQTSMKAAG